MHQPSAAAFMGPKLYKTQKYTSQTVEFNFMTLPNFSPAADRNKQNILDVLRQVLPHGGSALEVASGTGQHVAWFAAGLPQWSWQPTDALPASLASIAAWATERGLHNVRTPLLLDVMAPEWLQATELFDLIYCANMLHISPWSTCAALMHGSKRHLAPGGQLVTYGPYLEDDVPTSEGNLAFDQSLRARDLAWGIRRREDVEQVAAEKGLRLKARYAMPANNLLLVWTGAAA
jgi:cyclopropane fatty-acyl-phospholipid synthase-like methyltransferase